MSRDPGHVLPNDDRKGSHLGNPNCHLEPCCRLKPARFVMTARTKYRRGTVGERRGKALGEVEKESDHINKKKETTDSEIES